jgi:hypothetical protein
MQEKDVETIELEEGVVLHIQFDSAPLDPRLEWDNLAVVTCFHRDYLLGDGERDKKGRFIPVHERPLDLWRHLLRELNLPERQLLPVMAAALQDEYCREDYQELIACRTSREARGEWLEFVDELLYREYATEAVRSALVRALCDAGLLILPLYLYDHGGLTISTGSFSCPWDSGQVGYIYLTPARLASVHPGKSLDDPSGSGDLTVREHALALMESEVETYDAYLTGQVFRFVIDTEDEEGVDSRGGFYRQEDAEQEGRDAAQAYVDRYKDPERDHATNI